MKILITGSSGTIGTGLFKQLLKHNKVVGVDIKENHWCSQLNERTTIIDLRKKKEFVKLPRDFDLIVHLAANVRVYDSVKDPGLALDNMHINFNVFEFARENNINRVLFASSRETYGNIMEQGAISEEMVELENCESPYSASKISGEALIHAYSKVYGINFVIIRFSNVYGMYDDSDRVIPLWIKQALYNQTVTVYGKNKVLDFTYIDDAVNAIVKTIDIFDEVKENTFNIAYGKGIGLSSIAQEIKNLLSANSEIITEESRSGEVWKFEANISKAKELLDYKPKVGIEDGLRRTVNWYKDFYSD